MPDSIRPDAALRRAVGAFDAAAADFSLLSPHLWDRVGGATMEVSRPQPGERLLDACCGDGASAIPAARRVGSDGHVDAVDLSAALVEAVTRRSAELPQLAAHLADVTAWTGPPQLPGGQYDVVQCVLGIFFFPDMTAGTEHLIRLLRPGGRAAFTIWRQGSMVEIGRRLSAAAALVRGEDPPGPREPHLIDRVGVPSAYDRWLSQRGLQDTEVVVNELVLSLTPELAWLLVVGSGFRGVLTGLAADQSAAVREEYLTALSRDDINEVDATTLVATGRR